MLPVETVPPEEGLALREPEADRVVPREADVAVRPVGDIFHQPLHTDESGAVDMEGSTCHQENREKNLHNNTLTIHNPPQIVAVYSQVW